MQRIQNLVFRNFSLKWTQKNSETNCYKSPTFQNTKTISTGLSDFHKMVLTVLKQTFQRFSSNELVYRDYKNFEKLIYKRELEEKLNQQITEFTHFEQFF